MVACWESEALAGDEVLSTSVDLISLIKVNNKMLNL